MYIAYSALQTVSKHNAPIQTESQHNELLLRYEAYQSTCQKYHREITAIQQYLPGWTPAFK